MGVTKNYLKNYNLGYKAVSILICVQQKMDVINIFATAL